MTDRTITLHVTDEEYHELWLGAMHRHIGGPYPVHALAKQAMFGYLAKYPLGEARRAELEKMYAEAFPTQPKCSWRDSGEN